MKMSYSPMIQRVIERWGLYDFGTRNLMSSTGLGDVERPILYRTRRAAQEDVEPTAGQAVRVRLTIEFDPPEVSPHGR